MYMTCRKKKKKVTLQWSLFPKWIPFNIMECYKSRSFVHLIKYKFYSSAACLDSQRFYPASFKLALYIAQLKRQKIK